MPPLALGIRSECSLEMWADKLRDAEVIDYVRHTGMCMEVTIVVAMLILAREGWLSREGIGIIFILVEFIFR